MSCESAYLNFGAQNGENPELGHHMHAMHDFADSQSQSHAIESTIGTIGCFLSFRLSSIMETFPDAAAFLEKRDNVRIDLAHDKMIDVEKLGQFGHG